MRYIFVLILVFFFPILSSAQEDRPWHKRNSEGWFFYNEKIEPEPITEPKSVTKPEQTTSTLNEPSYSDFDISNIGAKWLRENLPIYQDRAIDAPTDENLLAYLHLQKLATDRADRFSKRYEIVVRGHPILDANARRPTMTAGANALSKQAANHFDNVLSHVADKAGLWLFLDQSEISILSERIMQNLRHSSDISTILIGDHGTQALFEQRGIELRKDEGHSEMMGVTQFPSYVLMTPEGDFDIAATGAMSLTGIKDNILISALRLDIISEEDYLKTKQAVYREGDIPEMATPEAPPVSTNKILELFNVK